MTTRNTILSLLVSSLCLSACGGGSSSDSFPANTPLLSDPLSAPVEIIPANQPDTGPATSGEGEQSSADLATARYTVTLENFWSVDEFPQGFPESAHLSLIGGATHNSAVSFWAEGDVASRGIEDMAEAGLIDVLLLDEVAPAIANGTANAGIEIREFTAPQVNGVPGVKIFELEMHANWPLVSLVTMLGPSPDWFVGVSGLPLQIDGAWLNAAIVDLPIYDGGSKSDITPIMGGPDIIPPNPIGLVAYDAATGVYLPSVNAQNVARITFQRVITPTQ